MWLRLSFVVLLRNRLLEFLHLAGADNAVGDVVDVAVNQIALASLHPHLLFAERTEEILHQSPVQVSTVFVRPRTFEVGKLSHLDEWMLGGGCEPFLMVEIEEYVKDVTPLRAFGYIALGQQDVADVPSV